MRLPGRGEFQIIDFLKERSRSAPGLIQGIGDDCAVIAIPDGDELLTTTDLLTEGVHFDLNWTDFLHLGRKAVTVNVSDLAAMGATPRFLFLSMALPAQMSSEDLGQFLSGFLQACDLYGVVLAGGDTCASKSGLTVSVTAQGSLPATNWIPRNGASPGDEIYVTGTLGDSAAALQSFLAGAKPDPFFVQRHINPTARVSTGSALAAAALPSAMIDISDGLLGDLEHILTASTVGARINLAQIPFSPQFRQELKENRDLLNQALAGGEDYELLFTVPPGSGKALARISEVTTVPITCIGKILPKSDGFQLSGDNGEVDLPVLKGYKHFPETE